MLFQAEERQVPYLRRHTERQASGLVWRLWNGVNWVKGRTVVPPWWSGKTLKQNPEEDQGVRRSHGGSPI